MNHPVQGHLDCDQASSYYQMVLDRRENELDELAYLTGWNMGEYDYYVDTYAKKLERSRKDKKFNTGSIIPLNKVFQDSKIKSIVLSSLALLLMTSVYFGSVRRMN